jgi:hypothetical protein
MPWAITLLLSLAALGIAIAAFIIAEDDRERESAIDRLCNVTCLNGTAGPAGPTGAPGPAGAPGATGAQGSIGLPGPVGPPGATGPTGAAGPPGPAGTAGTAGANGLNGTDGLNGTNGENGTAVVMEYGEFWIAGSQPAPVAAGQPLTFSQTVVTTAGITPTTGVIGVFSGSGTVFTLLEAGVWQVTFQALHVADDSYSVFAGATTSGLADLPYAHVGGQTGTSPATTSILVVTTAPNWVVAVVCAVGNGTPCTVSPNSSTTVASATTVTIELIHAT